jgi:hypothetical protein
LVQNEEVLLLEDYNGCDDSFYYFGRDVRLSIEQIEGTLLNFSKASLEFEKQFYIFYTYEIPILTSILGPSQINFDLCVVFLD